MTASAPRFRFRGNIAPSAEVVRPVAARRNAAAAPVSGQSPVSDQKSSATLDIFDVIDSFGGFWGISARDVDKALAEIGDVDTLYVRINSPGGEATEGVAIANMLRAFPADVRVTVIGLAASAASYISLAGDIVSMAPGSMLMIHDPWGLALGSADDMRAEANALDKLAESIASLYVLKAGDTQAHWQSLMDAETWMTAEDAVTAKLADRVGIDPAPSPVAAEDDSIADLIAEIEGAFDMAARRFDLSVFAHPPKAQARVQAHTKTPAEPPVVPSTKPEEADEMSDTLLQGLRERFGFAEDADEATIFKAIDEARDPEITPEAVAAKYGVPAEQVERRLKVEASGDSELAILRRELDQANTKIGELVSARAGDEATKKAEKKRDLFAAAFAAGKIGGPSDPERVEFENDYDEAPAVIERILAGRAPGSKFPVKASGYTPETDTQMDPASEDNYWLPGARKPAMTTAGD